MQRVYDNGHVYEGAYEGWYCPRCADFKTERELGPGNTCPIHEIALSASARRTGSSGSPSSRRAGALYEERPDFVVPTSAATRRFRSSSRGSGRLALAADAEVGVAAPWDTDQVIYVWFDALLNYYTALASLAMART